MIFNKDWELVGWNKGPGGNICLSLSEEQICTVFKTLGLKIDELPNGKYNITMFTDDYLRKQRLISNKTEYELLI